MRLSTVRFIEKKIPQATSKESFICKQVGHILTSCKLRRAKKRLACDMADFDMSVTAIADLYGIKVPEIKAPTCVVGTDDWV